MRKFVLSKEFELNPPMSERVRMLMRMFGLSIERLKEEKLTHEAEFEVEDGQVVYITGPSGAGKSVLLREIESAIPPDERINIEEIPLAKDKAAIDCIGPSPVTRHPKQQQIRNQC